MSNRYLHRVQDSVFGADNVASRVITFTTGVGKIPVGAVKFTLLLAGAAFTAASGGAHMQLAFTQGGNPLEGSVQLQNVATKLFPYGELGIEFDISTTPLTITASTSAALTNWGFWVIGFWS